MLADVIIIVYESDPSSEPSPLTISRSGMSPEIQAELTSVGGGHAKKYYMSWPLGYTGTSSGSMSAPQRSIIYVYLSPGCFVLPACFRRLLGTSDPATQKS